MIDTNLSVGKKVILFWPRGDGESAFLARLRNLKDHDTSTKWRKKGLVASTLPSQNVFFEFVSWS